MRNVKYFKRHRMELSLRHPLPSVPALPAGYEWLPWDDSLLAFHAETKFNSFAGHEDAVVFPSLGTRAGCHDLMSAIRFRVGFVPQATWLLSGPDGCAGTVQGLRDELGHGGIQNLGVVPDSRGIGLGRALLLKALHGFASARLPRAFLEVTATNDPAVRLYRSLGFRAVKVLYRAVELPDPAAVGIGL